METVQEILVYATLAIAVLYLVRKFLIPRRFLTAKKTEKPCGHDDCGCH